MTATAQTCSTCGAWRDGCCRRHAPRPVGMAYSDGDFPRVRTPPDYGCYEWAARPVRDVTEGALGRYRRALEQIASYAEGDDPAEWDEPMSTHTAREALAGEGVGGGPQA